MVNPTDLARRIPDSDYNLQLQCSASRPHMVLVGNQDQRSYVDSEAGLERIECWDRFEDWDERRVGALLDGRLPCSRLLAKVALHPLLVALRNSSFS